MFFKALGDFLFNVHAKTFILYWSPICDFVFINLFLIYRVIFAGIKFHSGCSVSQCVCARLCGGAGVLGGGGWSVSVRVASLLLCRVQRDLSRTQRHTRVDSAKVYIGGEKAQSWRDGHAARHRSVESPPFSGCVAPSFTWLQVRQHPPPCCFTC